MPTTPFSSAHAAPGAVNNARRWKVLRSALFAATVLLVVTWTVARIAAHQEVGIFFSYAVTVGLILCVGSPWKEHHVQRKNGINLDRRDRKEYRRVILGEQLPSNERVRDATNFYFDHYVRRSNLLGSSIIVGAGLVAVVFWAVGSIPASHPTGRYLVVAAALLYFVLMVPLLWHSIQVKRALAEEYRAPPGSDQLQIRTMDGQS